MRPAGGLSFQRPPGAPVPIPEEKPQRQPIEYQPREDASPACFMGKPDFVSELDTLIYRLEEVLVLPAYHRPDPHSVNKRAGNRTGFVPGAPEHRQRAKP